ncbi:hypothetical protein L9F63_025255, partial [Diploptera punctata]
MLETVFRRLKSFVDFRKNIRYEEFEMPSKLGKSEDEKGFVNADGGLGTPDSLPEPERPPLRHIDKYIRPECPCLSKRYTVAVLTCVGFIISFGMRCNMGMAKLQQHNECDTLSINLYYCWTIKRDAPQVSPLFR